MKKIILITGSGGLIGSEAVNYYCDKGFDVIGIDNDMRAYYFGAEGSTKESVIKNINLFKSYKHFEADIRDKVKLEEIFRQFKFDLIIHTAAQPSHDWAAKEPLTDFTVNAEGTLLLLENFRKFCPQATFIFTSTNKVYGDAPNRLPLIEQETRFEIDSKHQYKNGISEDMPIDNSTHSLFGVSKASADLMVQEYGRYFHLKTGIFRGGCLTGSKHAGVEQHGFLSYLVKCILTGKKYTIYGYEGKQVRDNIHAHDLIKAFDSFYKRPKVGEVYNIGGSRFANISIIEAVKKIEGISGRKGKTEYVDQNRIGDHIWYVSDVSKFKNHYPQWHYEYNIDATIEDICRNSVFGRKVFSLNLAKNLDFWKEKNWFFHNELKGVFKEFIPEAAKVLQVGYGLGDILSALLPKKGVSVDTDEAISEISKRRHPYLTFLSHKPEKISFKEKFNWAILPNSVDHFEDIQIVLEKVKGVLTTGGKVVITTVNPRWEQVFYILEKMNLKRKETARNWLRIENLKNLMEVSGYEVEQLGFRMLFPAYIPFLSRLINNYFKEIKYLSRFGAEQFVVAKKVAIKINKSLTCSIILSVANQEDDIKKCIGSIPKIGKKTEIIAVVNRTKDRAADIVKDLAGTNKNIKLIFNRPNENKQTVLKRGLDSASADILILYDSQMTIPAEELERAYNLLASNRAQFVNGTRLIYPVEGQRLRQFNIIANLIFGWFYSSLLKNRVTDVLCNVKAFYRKDYKKMRLGKTISNFDLLFAAAENKLKILELPVHYNQKIYLSSKRRLLLHTFLLMALGLKGFWKLKVSPFFRY